MKHTNFKMFNTWFIILILSFFGSLQGQELLLFHDKGGSPNFQPFYETVSAVATKEIGIGFRPTAYPDTSVYQATVRNALRTSKAPGLFTWWSTYRIEPLIKQGLIEESTQLWDKYKDEYPQGLREAFTSGGKVYGFAYTVEYWPVYYKKSLFKKLGLTPPQTWDDFLKLSAVLKSKGIAPMSQGTPDGWTTLINFEEMIIGQDPKLYNDLMEGKIKYTNPQVKKAFLVWKDLIEKGYFSNPNTGYFADMPKLFNDDKLAMILAGTWYPGSVLEPAGVSQNDLGAFILPSHNPSAGKNIIFEASPIFVGKRSSDKASAMRVVDWWMSSHGNYTFAKEVGSYAANPKTNMEYLPQYKVDLLKSIADENYTLVNRFWEATPSPIAEKAVDLFAKFILHPEQLDDVLKSLDRLADKYWAKNK